MLTVVLLKKAQEGLDAILAQLKIDPQMERHLEDGISMKLMALSLGVNGKSDLLKFYGDSVLGLSMKCSTSLP